MKKSLIHLIKYCKRLFIISAIVFSLYSIYQFGSNQYHINKYASSIKDLQHLFKIAESKKLQIASYKISDIISISDPLYIRLEKSNIIDENSRILITSADCISLIKKSNEKEYFSSRKDFIVMQNNNIGQFACGINSIYSLNQDETSSNLNIKVYQLDDLMNLFIVSNQLKVRTNFN